MPVKRVIKGVHVVPMGMANAFLIESDDGLTLSTPVTGEGGDGLRGDSRAWPFADQLTHLIFTHGHPDHIGSAAAIVRETGARTYMHPLDIPMAESGGPFRPLTPGPWSVAASAVQPALPSRRATEAGSHQPAFDRWGYCPSLAASKLFIFLGIARDRSRYCGVRDECCSRAMCA